MESGAGIAGTVKDLVGTVIGSLVRSLGLVLLVTPLCAGLGYLLFLRAGSALASNGAMQDALRTLAWLWVLVLLALGLGGGVMISLQRALLSALQRGVQRTQLGSRTLDALFRHVLGVGGAEEGGAVSKLAERLPLAEAEDRLRRAVASLLGAEGGRGLSGRLQRLLLGKLEQLALRRFRAEGASGIDLRKVAGELCAEADTVLAEHLKSARRRLTLLYALGGPAATALLSVILGQAWPLLTALRH